MKEAETFREEGVAVLRGVLDAAWLDRLADAVAANMASPGPYGRDHAEPGQGSYFGDYVNWRRFPAYLEVGREGPLGRLAAELTGASRVQFFHEHVLVKEPGTSQPTPWHQDMPYYCMSGAMTVSFWVPLDPVRAEVCPHFLAGSHRSRTAWLPRRFKTMAALEGDTSDYEPFPDIDEAAQAADIRSFDLEPGDAVAFDFHTLHNAPPNHAATRRRAVSLRYVGEDARYLDRPHAVSPPFPDLGLRAEPGEPLPEDWFPVVWERSSTGRSARQA